MAARIILNKTPETVQHNALNHYTGYQYDTGLIIKLQH